jgi:hypothetical protein
MVGGASAHEFWGHSTWLFFFRRNFGYVACLLV